MQVALLPSSTPASAACLAVYALTSANDAPERDPADWVLEGLPLTGEPHIERTCHLVNFNTRCLAPHRRLNEERSCMCAARQRQELTLWHCRSSDALPAASASTAGPDTDAVGAGSDAAAGAARSADGAVPRWRVLDAQEGVSFSRRGQRRDFQVTLDSGMSAAWLLSSMCDCLLQRMSS